MKVTKTKDIMTNIISGTNSIRECTTRRWALQDGPINPLSLFLYECGLSFIINNQTIKQSNNSYLISYV